MALSSGGKYTCYEAATPSAVSTINLVVMPKLRWINAKNMAYLVLGTPNAYIDASNVVGPTSITYTWSIDPENGTSFGNNTHMGYQYSVNHEFNQHQNTMRNNSQTDANAATNNSQQYQMNQHSLTNAAVHNNRSHYNSQQQSISRNSQFYYYAPGNRNHSRVRRHAFKYEQITSSGSQSGAQQIISTHSHSVLGFGPAPRCRTDMRLKLYAFLFIYFSLFNINSSNSSNDCAGWTLKSNAIITHPAAAQISDQTVIQLRLQSGSQLRNYAIAVLVVHPISLGIALLNVCCFRDSN